MYQGEAEASVTGLMSELTMLSRELGDERRDWAIVGEGNVSALADEDTMLVKASGSRLGTATPEDLVRLRVADTLAILDADPLDDDAVQAALAACVLDGRGRMPSVESLLHAVCLTDGSARFVAHTHPTIVNAFLCSDQASALVEGALFPDQIVVLGRHQLFIPYTDPGVWLARRARTDLRDFVALHGVPPRVIYLQSHGVFALGGSAQEVLDISEMVAKSARILMGSMSIGRPVRFSEQDAARIDTRPDERNRREILGFPAR
jgi:rhamnose utilization protein RhaD (predicted bifunctional aldolase and dehydrogenase)